MIFIHRKKPNEKYKKNQTAHFILCIAKRLTKRAATDPNEPLTNPR